jgi:hypothetical protein
LSSFFTTFDGSIAQIGSGARKRCGHALQLRRGSTFNNIVERRIDAPA